MLHVQGAYKPDGVLLAAAHPKQGQMQQQVARSERGVLSRATLAEDARQAQGPMHWQQQAPGVAAAVFPNPQPCSTHLVKAGT